MARSRPACGDSGGQGQAADSRVPFRQKGDAIQGAEDIGLVGLLGDFLAAAARQVRQWKQSLYVQKAFIAI